MVELQPIFIKVSNAKQIQLTAEMSIGRQAECDLQLLEGHASRRHAKLTVGDDGVWVEDLGSANGSFINGARITTRTRLNSGDRLRFDVEEFDFHVPAAAAATDEGKTVFRAPDSAAIVAESSVVEKRPGAWADPDALGEAGNKTRFIDPSQLKQMIDTAPGVEAPLAAIDGPHLHVVSGSRAGLNIKMTVGESGAREWTVGSQADREVQFHDSGVSALHAKIVNEGERWKVLDQMSANGTFVNGKRANVSYLSAGDRVRFGPVECIFQTSKATAAVAVMQAGSDAGGGKRNMLAIAVIAFVATVAVLFLIYKFML